MDLVAFVLSLCAVIVVIGAVVVWCTPDIGTRCSCDCEEDEE